MVSCGSCYQPFGTLFFAECADRIVRTTQLKRAGHLHVFRFKVHFVPGLIAEKLAVDQLGLLCHTLYHFAGFLKGFECHHLF